MNRRKFIQAASLGTAGLHGLERAPARRTARPATAKGLASPDPRQNKRVGDDPGLGLRPVTFDDFDAMKVLGGDGQLAEDYDRAFRYAPRP